MQIIYNMIAFLLAIQLLQFSLYHMHKLGLLTVALFEMNKSSYM